MRAIKMGSAVAGLVLIAACGAPSRPLPQDQGGDGSAPPSVTASTVSTCDRVREAILTGTQAQIDKAMKALQADKSADAEAREAAKAYLGEKNKDLRDLQVSLIQMQCSV